MIRKMQMLRSKRGFTMIELIVVIAIIAVMAATVLVGSSNRREKIEEANVTAADFYSAMQAEVTSLQIFDGPITMTLNGQYKDDNLSNLASHPEYCGVKYYPSVGGNYPFDGNVLDDETHLGGLPKDAVFYVEFRVFGGSLNRVDYSNDLEELLSGAGNENAELSAVLKMEMKDRMEYKNGYYYARISYTTPPTPDDLSKPITEFDYRTKPVRVDWTAYCANEVNDPDETFQLTNILSNQGVCGVVATNEFKSLGTAGTSFASAGSAPA